MRILKMVIINEKMFDWKILLSVSSITALLLQNSSLGYERTEEIECFLNNMNKSVWA